ncbi:MAG TPA: hypothetical protein DCS29_00230 [Candidatus Magasanikbacteria bacterium]|nr:hypothetical protein [Candidatus Magasanikbacteria bacterium]
MTVSLAEKTDNELVELTLQNQEYFAYIIERYKGKLLSYIKRISGLDYEDAEDVLQEVLVKVYYNLNGFDLKLKFSSWIYRVAHNEAISELRKRNVRPLYYVQDEDLARIADGLDMSHEVDMHVLQDDINVTLSKMDKKYREALVLKFLEEKDYNEISDILKKPIGTVGTLINRAKKQFKKLYGTRT